MMHKAEIHTRSDGFANADTLHDGIANAVEQFAPVPTDLQSGVEQFARGGKTA